jgi:DNA-binding NarL/FixJ family response regulator
MKLNDANKNKHAGMDSEKKKIVIADDHTLFRQGLKFILGEVENTEVVADVSNGQELIEATSRIKPDLIIMDISMPVLNGIEASRIILQHNPYMKILVVSMFDNEKYYQTLIDQGVKGFILKDADNSAFKEAVLNILSGRTYFSQELLLRLIRKQKHNPNPDFTKRELEVLEQLCKGLTTCEIAEKLFVSVRTVENHKASLLTKTGCKNSLSLLLYAIKNNLVVI